MPRHLISDAHEWINEIPTVPIYYLAKPQPRERAWRNQRGKKIHGAFLTRENRRGGSIAFETSGIGERLARETDPVGRAFRGPRPERTARRCWPGAPPGRFRYVLARGREPLGVHSTLDDVCSASNQLLRTYVSFDKLQRGL